MKEMINVAWIGGVRPDLGVGGVGHVASTGQQPPKKMEKCCQVVIENIVFLQVFSRIPTVPAFLAIWCVYVDPQFSPRLCDEDEITNYQWI